MSKTLKAYFVCFVTQQKRQPPIVAVVCNASETTKRLRRLRFYPRCCHADFIFLCCLTWATRRPSEWEVSLSAPEKYRLLFAVDWFGHLSWDKRKKQDKLNHIYQTGDKLSRDISGWRSWLDPPAPSAGRLLIRSRVSADWHCVTLPWPAALNWWWRC